MSFKLSAIPVVYLAGGMKGDWQDKVIESLGPNAICIDPRKHGSKEEAEYTRWDLEGVNRADIVFGYLEASNPGGAGLAVEFGFAYAQGKELVLTIEDGYAHSRYFGMVRAVVAPVALSSTFEKGLLQLQAAVRKYRRPA